MPPPPSSEPVRLAHLFVRLPNHHQQNGSKPTGQNGDSGSNPSASTHHQLPAPTTTTPSTPTKTHQTPSNLPSAHLPPTPTSTKPLKRPLFPLDPAPAPDPETPSRKRLRPAPLPHQRPSSRSCTAAKGGKSRRSPGWS
ncbi:hypothetical protein HO173_002257 [Letharia columbiana]|uniref:Uncharacterized protein n=1 Tax=Letharia columbiana TaxID=112416 RepID=A0A8H6G391_9LECA|nr:uncharacterized protein HO173_002257 [Letharia columbiana]KAF6239711.1 hypothetical protein HO173_002257 [Letharia columbiana]